MGQQTSVDLSSSSTSSTSSSSSLPQYDSTTCGLLPSFLVALSDPKIKTVLLCGCGGGCDFLHSMILYPELKKMGKEVVIASFSFGQPCEISNAEVFDYPEYHQHDVKDRNNDKKDRNNDKTDRNHDENDRKNDEKGRNNDKTDRHHNHHKDKDVNIPINLPSPNLCVKVTSKSEGTSHYAPEVHFVRFLDTKYPNSNQFPHFCYAMYARAFTPITLRSLYNTIINTHKIDAIIVLDGGNDALLRGDEQALGDPIEDAVSVATIATLENKRILTKLLLVVGFGCDRFNDVSDACSLRAIAELTRMGGFRGAFAIEENMEGFELFRELIRTTNENQSFHSVVSNTVVAAVEGWFGNEEIPPMIKPRIRKGSLYIWPIMGIVFAFDINSVFQRSLICKVILKAKSFQECDDRIEKMRKKIKIREIEQLPKFEDYARCCQ